MLERFRVSDRGRFTLIELLVVVSIIAVLAAMLLPALSKARAMAQVTVCLNNHKQLAGAMDMYASEFAERYPIHAANSPGEYAFPDLLADAGILSGSTSTQATSSYVCPDYDMSQYTSNYSQFVNTYSMHRVLSGYLSSGTMHPAFPGIPRDHVKNTSETCVTGDGLFQTNPSHVYLTFSQIWQMGNYHAVGFRNSGPYLRYAHNNAPVGGFVDGHAERRRGPWTEGYDVN